MTTSTLAADFEHYSHWRNAVSRQIMRLADWLNHQELGDAETDLRLKQLQDKLREDRLNVAFVAEFSRGKSELINAIFFADYRQRVLPSAAGRTTMCPTELQYSEGEVPAIHLLPIETRAEAGTVADFKAQPERWTVLPLHVESTAQMAGALQTLAETVTVSGDVAAQYGLVNPQDEETARALTRSGTVEIPRWRHAVINFPHPLLKQGLVILDTPGLNAIGTEPELTLNLLPSAHAVLFILAADTGVTKSDITIWRHHIAPNQNGHRGRLVVLNKIDGLWDDLKSPEEVNAEIARQARHTAELLELPADQVFPISAQKALVAKVQHDDALLAKSRLPALEAALSGQLIPAKQQLVREATEGTLQDMVVKTTELLEARLANIQDQIEELEGLRGKNRDVILQMMVKANADKKSFDTGLKQFNALRSIFADQAKGLKARLSMEALRAEVRKTRQIMESGRFSKTLLDAMKAFFSDVKERLGGADGQVAEIQSMMSAMYRKFSEDFGLATVSPPAFSLEKYRRELLQLEQVFNERFNTVLQMITQEHHRLTSKFFDTLASRVVLAFEIANRETHSWLKAQMAPMDTQVRERSLQLKRRLDSVRRIHEATETLDQRIQELGANAEVTHGQMEELALLNDAILAALEDQGVEAALTRRA